MTNAALIANDPGWLILAKAGIIFRLCASDSTFIYLG